MIKSFEQFKNNTINEGLSTIRVYVVTEYTKKGTDTFAKPLGVYSSLELAQARMNNCYEETMNTISDTNSIISYEQDPMETTILFNGGKHIVFIDECNIDEDIDWKE